MKQPTDFAKYMSEYLTEYLPLQRNLSKHTLASYGDSLRLFLKYCRDERNIKIERLTIKDIKRDLVESFLNWLISERKCSVSTRNQRLSAIHGFFTYIQCEKPELIAVCQSILAVPMAKSPKPHINYLNNVELSELLTMPDTDTENGRRDLTLLSLLYDTGARVSEIVDMKVRDIRLETPAKAMLHGKMRKSREVPLLSNTALLLKTYISEQHLNTPDKLDFPLFFNRQRKALSRAGITYILKKYVGETEISQKVTPHVVRHSKAMHLLEAGINIIYIRDLLGHDDVTTTQIYAKANIETKRKLLEDLPSVVPDSIPAWAKDTDTLEWLKSFSRNAVR